MMNPGQYIYLVMVFALILVFIKIGQADEEIGWILGLAAGFLIPVLNHFWPRTNAGLILHSITALAFLTAYKILQGYRQPRDSHHDDDDLPGRNP